MRTRNLLCVPLQVGERVIGVLEVVNRRDEGGFSEEYVSLIEGFSGQAAVALERAQLVERRIHGERLEAIGRTVAGLTHCFNSVFTGPLGAQVRGQGAKSALEQIHGSRRKPSGSP